MDIQGERPYSCTHCGKSFGLKWTLNLHLTTHSSERPTYSCDQCMLNFSNSKSLQQHLLISHLGERPFKCWICGTAFRCKDNLEGHIKGAHNQPEQPEQSKEAAEENLAQAKDAPVLISEVNSDAILNEISTPHYMETIQEKFQQLRVFQEVEEAAVGAMETENVKAPDARESDASDLLMEMNEKFRQLFQEVEEAAVGRKETENVKAPDARESDASDLLMELSEATTQKVSSHEVMSTKEGSMSSQTSSFQVEELMSSFTMSNLQSKLPESGSVELETPGTSEGTRGPFPALQALFEEARNLGEQLIEGVEVRRDLTPDQADHTDLLRAFLRVGIKHAGWFSDEDKLQTVQEFAEEKVSAVNKEEELSKEAGGVIDESFVEHGQDVSQSYEMDYRNMASESSIAFAAASAIAKVGELARKQRDMEANKQRAAAKDDDSMSTKFVV